jgi:hypothetical protein
MPMTKQSVAARRIGTGSPPTAATVDLRPVISAFWQAAREELRVRGLQFLSERDIGGGFRTSHNGLYFANDLDLFAGWDGRGFTIKFVAAGNRLDTQIRTPGPLPSGTDPKLRVMFDLAVSGDVDIQNNTLRVGTFRVTPTVHRPTGRNFTGDMAIAVDELMQTLAGTGFIERFAAIANGTRVPLNTPISVELAKLSPVLGEATSNAEIQPGMETNRLILSLVRSSPAIVK